MCLKICHITSVHKRFDVRIFTKECKSLASQGYDVNLIVADGLKDAVIDGISIFDVGAPHRIFYRISRVFYITYKIYRKALKLKPDLIHFHDPELMIIGYLLSKNGYKVVYDAHEDLPKQVLAKHWIPRFLRKLTSFAAEKLERYFAKYFAGIVTATEQIANRFKRYNQNVCAVCNYPSLNEMSHFITQTSHASNQNTPPQFTPFQQRKNNICYVGSISKSRGIIPLVLSLKHSQLQLELAGIFSGDISLDELHYIDKDKLINYHGVLDRNQIIELLSNVKVGVVTLLPTPSYIESLPIKLFEYMLAGIPVVASNFPNWCNIITTHNCGVMVDPNNPMEIADACIQLINNPDIAHEMGQNGQNAVLKYYNWENETQKLYKFYSNVLIKYYEHIVT